MSVYFLLLDADRYRQEIVPALAASWRQRSFQTCRRLCAQLAPMATAFHDRYDAGSAEPYVCQVVRGVPFSRDLWRLLVGEVLLYAAAELPEIQTAPETLRCLLTPGRCRVGDTSRELLAPIEQVHFGSRDAVFGPAFYRPDSTGLNDVADVARLSTYLDTVDVGRWSAGALQDQPGLATAEDCQDELEFAREWFPVLRDMYAAARRHEQIIICDRIDSPRDG